MLLKHLSKSLMLDEAYISKVASTASVRYKRFEILKANKKDKRVIFQPSKEVKALQRVLHDTILGKLRVHEAAMAYGKGCDTKTLAEKHKNHKYLLRLDFSNFFESVSLSDISFFMNNNADKICSEWTSIDTDLLSMSLSFDSIVYQ
jgi:RNA-directed DNA polymerase